MSDFQGLPKTKNLNLNKPGYDNVADIMALNENADIIDAAIKTNIDDIANIKKGYVKTVNGVGVDSKGNVNVKEYTHPNSGVTAGTYRSVTVNAQGHVTDGSNPTLAIADGGTGATTAEQACANIGIGDYVIAQYCDSPYGDFYRVWKSGFVEQGGIVNSNTYWQVVTLYQEMADTNFNVIVSIKYNGDIASKVYGIYAYPATAKTFNVYQDGWPSNDGTIYPIMWYAFGKGA